MPKIQVPTVYAYGEEGSVPLLDSYGVKSGEQGGSGYLREHRAKVEQRFTPMKRRARAMYRFIQQKIEATAAGSTERDQLERLSKDIGLCRNHLLFKNHFTEQRVTLSKMTSCKHTRLCPLCAIADANAHVATYHKKALQLIEKHREEQGIELHAYFVTLTVKNGVSLPDTYEHFNNGVQRLVDRRRAALKARAGSKKHQYALKSVMASVVAGVFSFEVKRGRNSGDWHPHAHGLLLSAERINNWDLSAEWLSMMGDSKITDCRPIDPADVKSLCEVLKYALKFGELSLEDNFDAAVQLRGKRFLRSFGEFYDLKPDADADIDDTSLLDSPYIEQLYSYRKGSYQLLPSDGAVKQPESYTRNVVPMPLYGSKQLWKMYKSCQWKIVLNYRNNISVMAIQHQGDGSPPLL